MMTKKMHHLFFLFVGVVLFCGSAFGCKDYQTYGTVSGQLVDARDYGDDESSLSENDQAILNRAGMFGPHLVLIEDKTNRVVPFYYGDEDDSVEAGDEQAESYVGKHIQASGCIGDPAWPAILVEGDITEL